MLYVVHVVMTTYFISFFSDKFWQEAYVQYTTTNGKDSPGVVNVLCVGEEQEVTDGDR
jgi:hypothetical protein